MKKKRIIIIVAIVVALILLFPVPIRYRDGGSVELANTLTIPELAGVTFEYTSEKLTANGEVLIWGMPIYNVYLADLNGDGVPEICATPE